MAPALPPRAISGEHIQHVARSFSSILSRLSTREDTPSGQALASVFALVMSSSPSVSRRAVTSLAELPAAGHTALAVRSTDVSANTPLLLKRQNQILVIPTIYEGLNSGPAPGAVVGIILGSILGFLLILYVFLISVQFFAGGNTTIIEKETIVKRKSTSRSKSRKSSRHSAVPVSVHEPSPPPPPRSRRETIIEIEEEFIRHSPPHAPSHHSPSRHSPSHHSPSHHSYHSPSPDPEEVIVEEEESMTEEIVEVIEEQSSIVSPASPSPPPRKQSSRRSGGFRVVDPAEFGGGDAPMRRIQSRDSRRSRYE